MSPDDLFALANGADLDIRPEFSIKEICTRLRRIAEFVSPDEGESGKKFAIELADFASLWRNL